MYTRNSVACAEVCLDGKADIQTAVTQAGQARRVSETGNLRSAANSLHPPDNHPK